MDLLHLVVLFVAAALGGAVNSVAGHAGAGAARRIGQRNVRRMVVLIGLTLTVVMLIRQAR